AALNSNKDVIEASCIFRGTVDCCPVHPREIFRFAYIHNASSIVLGHNHPSGTAEPSVEDHTTTKQLLNAAEILQIPIVDHLIVAGERYFSFSMKGLLPSEQVSCFAHSGRSQRGEK
ncbi:MAG: JAB domain-containing protein, partial [Bdellovibrionales bacterium]